MEQRIKYGSTLLCALIAALIIYGYFSHITSAPENRDHAAYHLSAAELINTANSDETLFGTRYLDKILSIKGRIRDIQRSETGAYNVMLTALPEDEPPILDTIASATRPMPDLVIVCSMDSSYGHQASQLHPGDHCTIQGTCAGLLHNIVMVQCITE